MKDEENSDKREMVEVRSAAGMEGDEWDKTERATRTKELAA